MPLYYPTLRQTEKDSSVTDTFLGINRRLRIADGEFFDMQNLTSDEAPVLSTRKARGTLMSEEAVDPHAITTRAATARGTYQAVFLDGSFLRIGSVAEVDLTPYGYEASGDKHLASMGAYIIILPDMIYVNTVDTADVGRIRDGFRGSGDKVSEAVATMTMCDRDGEAPHYIQATEPLFIYREDSDDYEDVNGVTLKRVNGLLWQKSGEGDGLYRFAEEKGQWEKIATYVKLTVNARYDMLGVVKQLNFSREIRMGDILAVKGLQIEVDGVKEGITEGIHKVIKVFDRVDEVPGVGKALVLEGTMTVPSLTVEQDVTGREMVVERFIPTPDFICEAGNRLWACRYGDDGYGHFVNEIYGSAPGDFFRWGKGAADSENSPVTLPVGTDGPWTGAVNYDGHPTFFKERCMHRVGGYTAGTFALYDVPCMGVARGAHRSLAVVRNTLYYKSTGPVMSYDGSAPLPVSDALGRLTGYTHAVGGACGGKYYLAIHKLVDRKVTDRHMYVLDTDKNLWHREDDTEVESMASAGDNLWFVAINRRYVGDAEITTRRIMTVEPTEKASPEEMDQTPIIWYAETGIMGLETTDARYLDKVILKLSPEAGSSVRVSVRYDSRGDWKQIAAIEAPVLKTVPVAILPARCDHMRLRIDGVGPCKIYSITRIFEKAEEH